MMMIRGFVLACLLLLSSCGGGGGNGSGATNQSGGNGQSDSSVGAPGTGGGGAGDGGGGGGGGPVPGPVVDLGETAILFVTSVPGTSFMHQLNTFANHGTGIEDSVPGGDLWLRYGDGTLRNLTKEAGWGVDTGGIQGGVKAIAVRQPTVHWEGGKAVFSMLVGGPTARFQNPTRRWQMYEVTGFRRGETAVITKVPNQPTQFNNISPIYGSDDQIIFSSDAPLYGMTHTYPQLDEYENTPTNTGIWKLNPATGALKMIEHSPSGVFDLFLDSHGRILFTKWDHLKRDQQADLDRYAGGSYNPHDVASEAPGAPKVVYPMFQGGKRIADNKGVLYDVFPEARHAQDPTRNPNETLHDFNQFFVWQVNEDGTEEETINHAGRHEFGGTFMDGIFMDDPNLTYLFPGFTASATLRDTITADSGIFQLREDPMRPGTYYGTYAKEFGRQAAGRIFEFSMAPGVNPENVVIKDYTNASLDDDPDGLAPRRASMTGHYRSPLKLRNGSMLVSHTLEYRLNRETSPDPLISAPRYVFLLKQMTPNPAGTDYIAGASLTGGIVKNIRWWTDDATPHTYNGPLNEHDAVEIAPRPRPNGRRMPIEPTEKQVLNEEGIDEARLRNWLISNNLALIVSRNVTIRDRADISQPFNLRIPGGTQNVPAGGRVYDIEHFQIFQGDLTRGYGATTDNGRRVYVKPLHNSAQQPNLLAQNIANAAGPEGSVKLGLDGSMAAFVPAGRAITWQTTSPTGQPIVRERVWVSFAPGEIRTCASCHGVNSKSHNNLTEPLNKPQALRDLMQYWKTLPP